MMPDEEYTGEKRFSVPGKRMLAIGLIAFLFIVMSFDPALALRNPAAVYCRELGYEYMIFYE